MSRDAALVSTWGQPIPGREAKALEVFMDFMTLWGKQAAEGKCTEPEAFIATDGSGGFAIVKGKSDVLQQISESEEALDLIVKAQTLVGNLESKWYYTDVIDDTSRYARILAELGYA